MPSAPPYLRFSENSPSSKNTISNLKCLWHIWGHSTSLTTFYSKGLRRQNCRKSKVKLLKKMRTRPGYHPTPSLRLPWKQDFISIPGIQGLGKDSFGEVLSPAIHIHFVIEHCHFFVDCIRGNQKSLAYSLSMTSHVEQFSLC